jgi:hypothetical protein
VAFLYNIGEIGGVMSRFIDKLNRVGRVTAQSMGFRTAPSSSAPKILLIASLAQWGDAESLAGSFEGADAVLLRLAKSALAGKTLQKIARSLPDVPWGGWGEDISAKEAGTMVGAGCDFVVFPASSRVAATPQDDKVGKVLQVELALDDGLLRAVNGLPVDAVLAAGGYEAGGSMAWHQLIQIQRLANLVDKPLLVLAPPDMAAGELKALWEAGADGVVVEFDAGQPGRWQELRQSINELPPRTSRKRGKAEALLPRLVEEKTAVIEEEEEEEEEEDE